MNLVERVKNILLQPKSEWQAIEERIAALPQFKQTGGSPAAMRLSRNSFILRNRSLC